MVKKKLLILGCSYQAYQGALYQKDLITELAKLYEVHELEPKIDIFENEYVFNTALDQIGFIPDFILLNHSWLSDKVSIKSISSYSVKPINIKIDPPVAIFLNKEYANLEAKVNYINSSSSINLVFSHYQHCQSIGINKPITFIPFAVSTDRIDSLSRPLISRSIRLHFSGILANKRYTNYSRFRLQIQSYLFLCIGNFPILKRVIFFKYRISWHPLFYSQFLNKLINLFPTRKRLSESQYFFYLKNSVYTLCPISPLNLISTRLFEVIASGSIPLVESIQDMALIDPFISRLLSKYTITSQEELGSKLKQSNLKKEQRDLDLLRSRVLERHTWGKRAEEMTRAFNKMINTTTLN